MELSLTRTDLVVYIYNAAVVLSGAYAVTFFRIGDRFAMLGISFVVAIFWTIYFKYSMRSRFAELVERRERRDDEADEETA